MAFSGQATVLTAPARGQHEPDAVLPDAVLPDAAYVCACDFPANYINWTVGNLL